MHEEEGEGHSKVSAVNFLFNLNDLPKAWGILKGQPNRP